MNASPPVKALLVAINDLACELPQILPAYPVDVHETNLVRRVSQGKARIATGPYSMDMRRTMIVQVNHDPVCAMEENGWQMKL